MMLESARPSRRFFSITLRTALVLGLMIPPIYAIVRQWNEVRAALIGVNWQTAAVSLVILLAAQPLMGVVSWIALRHLNQFFPYVRITSIYFLSQAAKYLPGGIWAFPSRVIAYRMIGVENDASVISLVQEVAALFLGAASLGLAALIGGLEASPALRTALTLGVLACCTAVILAQHPAVWRLIARLRQRANVGIGSAAERQTFNLTWMPPALLAALTFWLITGWGFHILVGSVDPQAGQMTFLEAAGIFALAWCAGFVVVIAPSGLGVRETALTALLLPYMPMGTALSVALLARLWWTLGEAVFILLSLLITARKVSR